ncbi:NAD-dependent epimerase/dehydratase family protein [Specibacter cremeus]|uniref:NAD-dependent epimerase/dehydratase family protein n=1 Tax=Specibacter cremeus TaxID=1629051 RepID=UPI001F0BC810|nr:NAD-dependent epimerase/dehydratase family protein [Specibacter cremeus]
MAGPIANILILGGTGWLGRTLAGHALAAGHAVTCLARGESGAFAPRARAVVVDRDEPGAYGDVAGPWDLVVELTSRPAHARGALGAVSAAHWTFVSSCSVYADHSVPGGDEYTALLPANAGSEDYGEAKSACERLTREAFGGALVVRPGLIGGPGDPSGRTTYWPLRFADPREPVLVPVADQHVQLIDVRDLAAFILAAGRAGASGAVNVVGAAVPLAEALSVAGRRRAGPRAWSTTRRRGWTTTAWRPGAVRARCRWCCRWVTTTPGSRSARTRWPWRWAWPGGRCWTRSATSLPPRRHWATGCSAPG